MANNDIPALTQNYVKRASSMLLRGALAYARSRSDSATLLPKLTTEKAASHLRECAANRVVGQHLAVHHYAGLAAA